MENKILILEKNIDLFFENLMQLAEITGVKEVSEEFYGKDIYYFNDPHYVLYTETKMYITMYEAEKKHFFGSGIYKSKSLKIELPLVSQKYLNLFPALSSLFIINDNSIYFNLSFTLFNKAVNSSKAYCGADEYLISKSTWNSQDRNTEVIVDEGKMSLIESCEKVLEQISNKIKVVDSEHWKKIAKGNNDFMPNIINDLKYGGRY